MGIWGSPKPILPPPAAARLLVFTSIIDAWLMVFKATVDLRKTEEVRANHNATKFTGVCFLWVFFVVFFFVFLAVLGLCCCVRAFSSCSEWGLLLVVVRALLNVVASLVAEHGL